MIEGGHSFSAIENYTAAQINLFAKKAIKSMVNRKVDDARISTIAFQAGFTGDLSGLKRLESQARRVDPDAGSTAFVRDIRTRLRMAREAKEGSG